MSHTRAVVFGAVLFAFACMQVAPAVGQLGGPDKEPPLSIPKDPPLSIPKAEKPETETANARLHIEYMLDSKEVFPTQTVTDGIWEIEATTGRMLVRIPLTPQVGEKAMTFDSNTVKLSGGRFICYQLINPGESASAGATTDVVPETDKGLPTGVPRMARELIVHPNGKVSWELERRIIGAKVRDTDQPFNLLIDRELLAKLEPQRPKFDPNQDAQTRRAEQAEYREKQLAFLQLRRELVKLPDEFKGETPGAIWAVFELRSNARDLSVEGPKPLPWEMPIDLLQAMQSLASGQGAAASTNPGSLPSFSKGAGSAEAVMNETLKLLAGEKPHVYSQRLVARTIVEADLIKTMKEGDPTFKVITRLFEGDDSETVGDLTQRLALIGTGPAAELMKTALSKGLLDSRAQLGSVQGMLELPQANSLPQDMTDRMNMIHTFMNDPKGASPQKMVAVMVEKSSNHVKLRDALKQGVSFDAVQGERLGEFITAIIERAPTNELARHWLNVQLLGGNDAKIKHTVALLSRTTIAESQADQPTADDAPRTEGADGAAANDASKSDTTKPDAAATDGDAGFKPPVITGHIPMNTLDHNLFSALQHQDLETRRYAWRSLKVFEMGEVKAGPDDPKWYDKLFSIAINESPTPPYTVEFLARHREPGVDHTLAQLVNRAEMVTSKAASQAMLGSGRPIGKMLVDMKDMEDRFRFGLKMYENIKGQAPYAVGLLRDQSRTTQEPLTTWFGEQVKTGRLPLSASWLEAYKNDESQLLEILLSKDDTLVQAAIGALTTYVGGSAADVPDVAARFKASSARSVPDLNRLWSTLRKEIFANRLKRTSGQFAVSVLRAKEVDGGGRAWVGQKVGDAAVSILGDNVKIGSAAATIPGEKHMVLRMAPEQIKQLPGDAPGELALDPSVKQLDFHPREDGSWAAMFLLADGTHAQIVLEKAK